VSTPHQLRRPATPEAVEHAFDLFKSKAKRNVDLSQFTTYKVGGTAALHMMVSSIDDLYLVSAVLAEVELPILVIGRGSNLLISDSGFKGLALTIGGLADYVDLPNRDEEPEVEPIALFGGSVALPVAARQSVARGLMGNVPVSNVVVKSLPVSPNAESANSCGLGRTVPSGSSVAPR